MADLDTEPKRRSAMGLDLPWPMALPLPDGTIEQRDRQHLSSLYGGIAITDQGPTVGEGVGSASSRRRRYWRR